MYRPVYLYTVQTVDSIQCTVYAAHILQYTLQTCTSVHSTYSVQTFYRPVHLYTVKTVYRQCTDMYTAHTVYRHFTGLCTCTQYRQCTGSVQTCTPVHSTYSVQAYTPEHSTYSVQTCTQRRQCTDPVQSTGSVQTCTKYRQCTDPVYLYTAQTVYRPVHSTTYSVQCIPAHSTEVQTPNIELGRLAKSYRYHGLRLSLF